MSENTSNDLDWISASFAAPSETQMQAARLRQNSLTKPPGSLGVLEEIALRLCAMQDRAQPEVQQLHIRIFAADHGIAEEGVSAFPQAVTAEMVRNFSRGGAAISVLARELGADLRVINVGTLSELESLERVEDQRIGAATQNFSRFEAMSEKQLVSALDVGRSSVQAAKGQGCELFIGGEMGIANTSSATALACALLGLEVTELVGPGTGLDAGGVAHKTTVLENSLRLHREKLASPLDSLRCLGGFEIAALTGAYIACAQTAMPAVVDGFISSVAALYAAEINPGVKDWLFFSHASAEPGHQKILQAMQAKPLIDFNMRLGEGSGAASVVPLMRLACALHNQMATFDEASVSNAGD